MAESDYCTWAEVRDSLGIPASVAQQDERVKMAVTAASRSIDGLCGRFFDQRVATRVIRLRPGTITPIPDAIELTAFGVYDTLGSLGAWAPLGSYVRLIPEDALALGLEQAPATALEAHGALRWLPGARAQLTGTWGWPTVPAPVKSATMILAGELWKMKDAPFGVAGFGEYGAVRVRANPKVLELVRQYVTPARMLGGL